MPTWIKSALHDLQSCWKRLFLLDLIYKFVAIVALTPLAGMLFRTLMAISGNSVLADQDILWFFLGPVGWLCLIVVGAISLGIVALEQCALMGMIAANASNQPFTLKGAIRFAADHAWPVLRVTARMVVYSVFAALPFLAVGAVVYFTLLRQYDINYYLKEMPAEFQIAIGIGAVLATTLVAALVRLYSNWFFVLPMVVFENVSPRQVFQLSRDRAIGCRRYLFLWICGWGVATLFLSSLATTIAVAVGRFLVPQFNHSLPLLSMAIGTSLLIWSGVGLLTSLLSTTSFAAILFNVYEHYGRDRDADSLRLNLAESRDSGSAFRLTGMRLLCAVVLVGIAASTIGFVIMGSVTVEDDVKIFAHRGASDAAPENTMAAVNRAIEDGADWIEIDVQETADGNVVVFHDSDFMKLAGVDLKIWDATTEDLRDIDVGSWLHKDFRNERVPSLTDVLRHCKGKVGVNIELKYYGHDQQLEQRVVEIVEATNMSADVVVMSLKLDAVKKMKSIRPQWKVGLLLSVATGNLQGIDADFLAINASFVDRNFVRAAHNRGKEVYVWTVNDASTMSSMISRGVDGIITDKPAVARSVLQERSQMNSLERLLVDLAGIFGVAPNISDQ